MKSLRHWNKAVTEIIEGYKREEEYIQLTLDDMFFGWDAMTGECPADEVEERRLKQRLYVLRDLRTALENQILDYMISVDALGDYGTPIEVRPI